MTSRSDHELFQEFTALLKQKTPPKAPSNVFEGEESRIMAGLAVYRNNIRSSLSGVLGDKFPVIKQLVGEEFFKFLAHEYYHAFPPQSPLVTAYGDKLADFLETFAPVAAYPYLPDMARLERLWLEAYHAADDTPLKPNEIIAAAGENIADLTFEFHPSLRLFKSDYPVATLLQRHQASEADFKDLPDGAEMIMLARPYNDVSIRVLTHARYSALEALYQGQTLEIAIDRAVGIEAAFDPQRFFQDLFQFEIITRCAH